MSNQRPRQAHRARAIVLAAGNGDRFRDGCAHSKLTTCVAGTPLLARTLASLREAGISEAHVVLGFDADYVRAVAMERRPDGLKLQFHLNENWHEENGVSVLAARVPLADRPFALVMGDHLFDSRVLQKMLHMPRNGCAALLAIDRRTTDPAIVREATKVRLQDGRVTAIGKTLDPFDALDTGLFVCEPSLFAALDRSCASGDTALSGGISYLASRGLVRGVDIGDARWCDIDTVEDLAVAEDVARRASAA
jgi:choline kinase